MSMLPGLTHSARYALSAMVVLGRLEGTERISVVELATRAAVPDAFLSKLLRHLGRHGIVEGLKGHHGGYRLGRSASEIKLVDVLNALDDHEGAEQLECALGARPCNPGQPCALHHRWQAAINPMMELLHDLTVEQLVHNDGLEQSG